MEIEHEYCPAMKSITLYTEHFKDNGATEVICYITRIMSEYNYLNDKERNAIVNWFSSAYR